MIRSKTMNDNNFKSILGDSRIYTPRKFSLNNYFRYSDSGEGKESLEDNYSKLEILVFFLISLIRTSSYFYYIDNFKYIAMHFMNSDRNISLMYSIMTVPNIVVKLLSGFAFNKMGLKLSATVNLCMVIVYELLLLNFIRSGN